LRTPLTSIKGYADLMLAGEVGELTDDQQEFLTIVKNNSDRLVDLVSDLLDLSRIEAGHVELRYATLNVAAVINTVVTAFRPQVQRKGQRIVLNLSEDLPAVNGDGDRVIQILTNLVSNAHKYTPAGGRISISAQGAGAFVRIDVRDTGIGIAEEDYPQLFTKFYRTNNRAAREIGGTGLGLAITRSLVELQGGTISVSSTLDHGSTFSVTLPVALEPATSPTIPLLAQPHRQILVVDDEQDIAKLLQRYLQRAGYHVALAHDATAGLRLARSEKPDLITLDVLMQGTDGFTTLEWLKADPSTAAIPVMLISILEDSGRGKLLGAVDYLTKPIQEQFLLEHVAAVLAGHQAYLVLVADDDPDVRRLLAYILRQRGYQVVTAADGAEAVALAQRERPDLAVLDVRMPGTDGLAALAALRAGPTTRDIPVIMLTASPEAAVASWPIAERLGAARLMTTPCTAEELATAIAEQLRTGRLP
jgi:CheY-like chemotaxis protein/two-component sensor histidine kinase